MSTDTIDQDLNNHDRGIVEHADRLWQRIANEDGHYEDWSMVRDALMIGRQYAMRVLHTQEPRGKAYNDLFGRWRNRHFPKMSPATCSNLLFLADPEHRGIADELRRAMSDAERMQITHPDSMVKRVRRFLKERDGEEATKPKVPSLTQAKAEIAELKRRLASQGDGSLFDLQRDTIEDIATVLVGTNASRAERIARAVLRKVQKPAG